MACSYNISELRNLLLTDFSEVAMRDYNAEVSSAVVLNTKSIQFEGGSELNGTYAFGKKLTVEVGGLSVPRLAGKRLILEALDGSYYLIDEEFDASVTWRFTLDKQTESTVWDIEVPSNIQIKPCSVLSYEKEEECSYDATEKPYVITSPKASTLVNVQRSLYLSEYSDRLDGEVVFTESWDGVKYDSSLKVGLPLGDESVEFSDRLQRFVRYSHTFAVHSPSGWFVSGFEHGADVQVDIVTSTSDESGSLTLTFTEASDSPCLFFESLTFDRGESLFYDFVKYAHDGTQGFTCNGDGTAMYLLQRGFYQDGTSTKLYKALIGYTGRFPNLELTGVFYSSKTFDYDGCFITDTLSTTFPVKINFTSSGADYQGSVFSENSNWEVFSKPSFVTVTPDHGGTGSTNVVISASYEGTEPYLGGSVIFRNETVTTVVAVTLNRGTVTANPSSNVAKAFTVQLTGTKGYNVELVSSPSGITTTKIYDEQPTWTASIPTNNSTENRTFTWEFRTNGATVYATVTQEGCKEVWYRSGGYICENGNAYYTEWRAISYDGGKRWVFTGETRRGDLIEEGADYCSV